MTTLPLCRSDLQKPCGIELHHNHEAASILSEIMYYLIFGRGQMVSILERSVSRSGANDRNLKRNKEIRKIVAQAIVKFIIE